MPDPPPSADVIPINVIPIAGRKRARAQVRTIRPRFCIACAIVIDTKRRIVACNRCERVWDPIAALIHISERWERYARDLSRLKSDVDHARGALEKTKRELDNLRAQKRRLQVAVDRLERDASPPRTVALHGDRRES